MRTVVVYESMFGNTRKVAAIAEGFGPDAEVRVVPVAEAEPAKLGPVDLLVVGGPTHGWSMSRPSTRKGAPDYVRRSDGRLTLEPGADTGPGVREWLAGAERTANWAAPFDTKLKGPGWLTGRASHAMSRVLRRHGMLVVAGPESFLVDRKNVLLPGELDRARAWGARLATMVQRSGTPT
jgi:hypothetical protein